MFQIEMAFFVDVFYYIRDKSAYGIYISAHGLKFIFLFLEIK